MLKFLPYVVKNLLGHRARTSLTMAGTAVLLFLFLFVASIQGGLQRLLDSRSDTLIVFQAYRLCPSSSQLPLFYEETIRKIPGVSAVVPIKVVVNNCRASLDTVMFQGVDAQRWPAARPHLRFSSGDWSAFQSRQDAAIVGARLAERRGLTVGSEFSAVGVTVHIAGIFRSEQPGEENTIYTHLPALLLGHGKDEYHATLFEVTLSDPTQADAVAKAIDGAIADRYQIRTETKPQKAHVQGALADLLDVIALTRWLGFVCVGVVLVLVANAIIMAAQDRVKEHAVLQTLGYSGPRIVSLMLTESTLISFIGGLIGILGCTAWLYWHPLSLATEGAAIDFVATPMLIAQGLGLAALVGLAAGAVPAIQAGRANIVASLR
jgi:putative ABC transport system permease protein